MSGYARHPNLKPFDFKRWIDAHRKLLKPPVGNKLVFEEAGMVVMVVGGPNQRVDFHDDPVEEFFYQLEGDMVLKVAEDGHIYDVPIRAGEVFMLPPHVRHSPQRPVPGSVGLVSKRRGSATCSTGSSGSASSAATWCIASSFRSPISSPTCRRCSTHSIPTSRPARAGPAPRFIPDASRGGLGGGVGRRQFEATGPVAAREDGGTTE